MSEERVERLLAEVHDDFGMIRVLEVADYPRFSDSVRSSKVAYSPLIPAGWNTTTPAPC